MIELNALSKKYGSFTAVDSISLTVRPGEIFAFLGVNGAGKTTTIRMMAGILKPSEGSIHIGAHDMGSEPLAAKQITGYIPDRPYLYGRLTAWELLMFVAELYHVDHHAAHTDAEALLAEYQLSSWKNELIDNFSHGMKQRLATCAALIHHPQVLIVDEPMVGLDPHGAKHLKERFREYARSGMSIFLSTHSLNVAEEVADRLAIINHGKIIAQGSLAEIRALSSSADHDLEEIFLELTTSDNGSA
jgi:ABC-2 type transport system ATP-binding protein